MRCIFRRLTAAGAGRRWTAPALQDPCVFIPCVSGAAVPHLYSTGAWYQMDLPGPSPRERGSQERTSILKSTGVPEVGRLSREGLTELLQRSLVYRAGPLVALNKPPGLPITGDELSLSTVLPDLQGALSLSGDLHVVKTAARDQSGLVLLSTCHHTTNHLEDNFRKARRQKTPTATYWAVTVGTPDPPEGEIDVPLKLQTIGALQLVVPELSPSRGSVTRREVKRTRTRYRVLDSGAGCSLLQLQPLSTFQSQLQVHLSVKLSPVLGDHVYSPRVGRVLGVPISLPVETALPRTQVLQEALLRRMRLTQQQMHRMPLHLHLLQLHLPALGKGRKETAVTAPPPEYFLRTLCLLGLTPPEGRG